MTVRQFGFRTGRSCVTNLLSFYSSVIDITQERNGLIDNIYLELKLKNWMEDYLKGR